MNASQLIVHVAIQNSWPAQQMTKLSETCNRKFVEKKEKWRHNCKLMISDISQSSIDKKYGKTTWNLALRTVISFEQRLSDKTIDRNGRDSNDTSQGASCTVTSIKKKLLFGNL